MGAGDMKTAVQCKKCGKSYSAGVVGDFQGLCPGCVAAFAFEDVSQSPHEAPAPAAPPNDYEKTTMYLKPGTAFQGVVIDTVLGQGGMGVVYKARQQGLDRLVALKVMSDRLAGDPEFVKRFEKEAKAMATLSHPNIVAVYNYGIDNGRCFIVMEYVDGANLRHIIREKKLEAAQALRIVPQLCDALEYAHGEGVVHRDIKPENILIDKKGRVKITDFGLAKMVEPGRTDHTVTGLVMGTPHYMAPEQVDTPKTVDHRADIYSMGVVFYELLTGELPIGRWQLPSHRGVLDARLDQVVLRALEREPDKRYQHASDMKLEVSRVSEFIPVARLATPNATGQVAVSSAFSAPLHAPPGIVSAPSPASPGGVHVHSPAAANAGWNAPPGFASARPNTPVNGSRISAWVGTGFGLTIAAVVLAFAGLIVAGASNSSTAIFVISALSGGFAAFGFLCNTIGIFDILFNAGRRHGFGLAVMTYAMDLLILGLGVTSFLMVQRVESVDGGKRRPAPAGVATPVPVSSLMTTQPMIPAGWAVAPETRFYEGRDDMKLFWMNTELPVSDSVKRARRIVYVTGGEGGALAVNLMETTSGEDTARYVKLAKKPGDVFATHRTLVVIQRLDERTPIDQRKIDEVRAWVNEISTRESANGR